MALFPVQRYLGEDDSGRDISIGTSAEGNIEKLLSKIKQRSKIKNLNKISYKEDKNLGVSPAHPDSASSVNPPDGGVKNKNRKKKDKSKLLSSEDLDLKVQDNNVYSNNDPNTLLNDISRLKVEEQLVGGEIEDNSQDVLKEETSKPDGEVFPVIGDYKFKKKSKVRRVLPDWLANPSVVSVDLKNLQVSIHDIPGLHDTFINILKNNNITHFFPVQSQVIPWLLESSRQSSFFWPCDICVSAPTGSGKTLAYVLPILQALMGNSTGCVQAVVVLPVQELAAQVASVFRSYAVSARLRVHLSSGSLPLEEDRAKLLRHRTGVGWESLVDILVITPGRLVEHLYSTTGFSLKQIRFIVIDEADRIVDNMQNNWLHHLDQHLGLKGCPLLTLHTLRSQPRRPQRLLFSATLSIDPEKLNQLNLFQPRLFTSVVEATKDQGAEDEFIGKFTTPAELQEHVLRCVLAVKPLVLYQLITRDSWSRVLVFTSSSRSVHQLCSLLSLLARNTQHTLTVAELSAECSPRMREATLMAFAGGKVDVLVSTDAMARGMDIPDVRYVVSYDMPKYIKAYVHRVGRTGRAGHQGFAVTMVTHTQVGLFNQMLQTAGKKDSVAEISVTQEELKKLEDPFKQALKALKSATQGEEVKKLQKAKSLKRVTSSRILSKKRKKKHDGQISTKRLKR